METAKAKQKKKDTKKMWAEEQGGSSIVKRNFRNEGR